MDDLFEKLKSEKPVNKNVRFSGTEAAENEKTTMGNINKKENADVKKQEAKKNDKVIRLSGKENPENEKSTMANKNKKEPADVKNREVNKNEKTPQKVPTKGEQKYHGNINEKEENSHGKFLTKKVQVKVKKHNFQNDSFNTSKIEEEKEKVSTKAEKKQFNVDETLVQNIVKEPSNLKKVPKPTENLANDKIDKAKKSEATPKRSASLTRADQNKKRSIDVAKEVPVVPTKKENVDAELKLNNQDKTRNVRKRKSLLNSSSLSEGTTIKKKRESSKMEANTIANKLLGIKQCVVRLQQIDFIKYQEKFIGAQDVLKIEKETRDEPQEGKKKENNLKKVNEKMKISKKNQNAQKEKEKVIGVNKANNKHIGKAKPNKEANRAANKATRKARSPSKTASPEIKIRLPILTKKQNQTSTNSMEIEKVTRKSTTPKKRGRKSVEQKGKATTSNENRIEPFKYKCSPFKVLLKRCETLESMLVKLEPAAEVPQMLKNKKKLYVSFVEEVELIGENEEKKSNSSVVHAKDVEKEFAATVEYILPSDAPSDNMDRLVLSPSPTQENTSERPTTSNECAPHEKVVALNDEVKENSVSSDTEKEAEQQIQTEELQNDVKEDSVSSKTENEIILIEDNNVTEEENNLTKEENLLSEKENLVIEKATFENEKENVVAEKDTEMADVTKENEVFLLDEEEDAQEEEVVCKDDGEQTQPEDIDFEVEGDSKDQEKTQTDVHEEEEVGKDKEDETQPESPSVLVQEEMFVDVEPNVITLSEDECSSSIHADGGSLIHKICNNGHAHDIDLTSEHSNDGVIKNDVMMNGLDISNEINKPVLKTNLDNSEALDLIASDDDFGVSYSPSSFRSAHSDMETHAEKESETKLSDISDASEHDVFAAPEIATTVEVSEVDNVPIFANPASLSDCEVELPAADDVSGLLENIGDIRTKSPLEVERLNATLSLIDGDFFEVNWLCNITENALF